MNVKRLLSRRREMVYKAAYCSAMRVDLVHLLALCLIPLLLVSLTRAENV